MAQQFVTSSSAAVGPRIQDIDQSGTVVQRPVGYWRQVSWGAIFAGAVLTIMVQMLLTLLGIGIGLVAAIDEGAATAAAATPDNPGAWGIGAAVWWIVSGIISLFIGGLVAGRLSRVSQATDGIFHGLLVWSVATLFSIYLLTTAAASLIGGAFSGLTNALGGTAGQDMVETLPGMGRQGAAGATGDQAVVGGDQPSEEGIGADEPAAGERVGGFEEEEGIAGTGVEEREVAQAAQNTGEAALWSFFALTLGAVAAGWGGAAGRKWFSRWDEPTTVVSRTTSPPPQHQDQPHPQDRGGPMGGEGHNP